MAHEFYVHVEGTKQGRFKGESAREKHSDAIPGIAFHYNVRSPRDAENGQASGKRQHHPVAIVKEWGPSTPQFFQALCTDETLSSVLFEFVRADKNGEEYVYHTVRLVNAAVVEVEQYLDGRVDQDRSHDVHELERIHFAFQRIEMESKDGKTMAVDDWSQKF